MRSFPALFAAALPLLGLLDAAAEEEYARRPVLKNSFPAETDGTLIKGYDPVIAGNRCVTTFMAFTPRRRCLFERCLFER